MRACSAHALLVRLVTTSTLRFARPHTVCVPGSSSDRPSGGKARDPTWDPIRSSRAWGAGARTTT